MELTPDTVHVYLTHLALPEDALLTRFSWLSPDEQTRAHQFRFPQHRQSFIAARGFLRQILSYYLKTAPQALVFDYGTHKKPFIAQQPLHFNLAHSGELAVLAVGAQHPLGVDIEVHQPQAKMDVAERFFSPAEVAFLKQLTGLEQRDAFYRVWARKEAVVKAIGTGIQQSLASFTVPFGDAPDTLTVSATPWLLTPLSLHPDYEAALATHPSVTQVIRCAWNDETHAPTVQN